VFPALGQQLFAGLLVEKPQCVELLVVELGPTAHASCGDFLEPFGAMARCVNLLTRTGNGPASVDGLQATHHPREIFGDRQIATRQFLHRSQGTLSELGTDCV
jgi:hypothetical protein